MRTIFIFLICINNLTGKSQSCDLGTLDARVRLSLLKIGDLPPRLDTTSIEQAKQDNLNPDELFPAKDATLVKTTTDGIPIYVFNASHDKDLPVILYFHPGGFVTPFLPFMKYDCWKMSKDLHAIVFAVDYRIAPVHKFPAAVNDAYSSFEWLLANATMFGGDINKLVVAGWSAGANLAAVVSHKAKNNGLGAKIKLQVLNCPSVDNIDHQSKYPSYEKYATGYFQTREFIVFAQKTYCDDNNFYDPDFAPFLAEDFKGLPPAVMFTTEFDILKDEDMAYLMRLRDADVKSWHHCFAGQIHCLVGLTPNAPEFDVMNGVIVAAMHDVFRK